uniref:Uncharacterized protein n=1 Tax=viral metagenome TaxID=1070528 RepID=A0A6M3KZZ1_9ZZZZ
MIPWKEIAQLGGVLVLAVYIIFRLCNFMDLMCKDMTRTLSELRDAQIAQRTLIDSFINAVWGKEKK